MYIRGDCIENKEIEGIKKGLTDRTSLIWDKVALVPTRPVVTGGSGTLCPFLSFFFLLEITSSGCDNFFPGLVLVSDSLDPTFMNPLEGCLGKP